MNRKFLNFVLPSMLAMAFSGIYSIIDGIFVGNFLGTAGIAAINIAYPLQALVMSLGTGIGLGGGIMISIAEGRGEIEKKRKYLGTTLMLLLLATIFIDLVLYPLHPFIMEFLAAEETLYPLSLEYLKPLLLFCFVQLFGTGLVPIIRNYGGATYSMVGMITGFVMNIFLDWVLIAKIPMGMTGAALATLLGQLSALLVNASFFLTHRGILKSALFKPCREIYFKVLHTALSPFGETINPNITLLIMNYFILKSGGITSSSTYGVVCFVYFVGLLFIQGVGQGAQPLVSMYHGGNETEKKKHIVKLMYITSVIIYIAMAFGLYFSRDFIPFLFGAEPAVAEMYHHVILYFIVSLGIFAFVQIDIAERYASGKTKSSSLMIYAQNVFSFIYALIFTSIMGIEGAWLVQIAALGSVFIIQLIFRKTGR